MDQDFSGGGSVTNNDTTGTVVTPISTEPRDDIPVKSFADVLEKSVDFWHFCKIAWKNPWIWFVWFNPPW